MWRQHATPAYGAHRRRACDYVPATREHTPQEEVRPCVLLHFTIRQYKGMVLDVDFGYDTLGSPPKGGFESSTEP